MCEIINSSEFQCGPFGGKELVFVGSKWDTTLQKFGFFFFFFSFSKTRNHMLYCYMLLECIE